MKSVYNCIECGCPLSGKQRSFCSVACKNDHFLSYDVVKERALVRKEKLVKALKGGCHRCGYATSLDALSFYDSDGQTLHIDTNVLANSNYQRLLQRLQDSQVLCRNCVEEIGDQKLQNNVENDQIYEETVQKSYSVISEKTKQKFAYNFVQFGLNKDQVLVLGVSGGIDSAVMLDLFSSQHPKDKLIAVHVNHALRPEADADEIFVRDLAKKYGVRFLAKRLTPHTNGNQEEYFRDERRKYLLEVAASQGAAFVALAHNADDQAETFIMNAVRGSGPAGLGAMKMCDKQILRPLLDVPRSDIVAYAQAHQLTWHEDTTNTDTTYSRNYIRHRILPLLTRLNPDYLSNLGRTTRLQRQIDEQMKLEALAVIARSQSDAAIPFEKDCFVPRNDAEEGVFTKDLQSLSKPLLYEVIGLLYEQKKGDRQNLALSHIKSIEDLIANDQGTRTLDLPGDIVARRRYDKLDFYSKKAHNVHSTPSTNNLQLGSQNFGGWKVSVSQVSPLRDSSTTVGMTKLSMNDEIVIPADLLENLVVRTRQPGDRIASLGLNGRKKIQDLFIDAKIDREKRDTWPIVVDKATDEIIWVPGLARTNIKPTSKKLLTLSIVEAPHETIKEK